MNAEKFANKNNHKFLDVCTNEIFYGNASLILEIIERFTKKDKDFFHFFKYVEDSFLLILVILIDEPSLLIKT